MVGNPLRISVHCAKRMNLRKAFKKIKIIMFCTGKETEQLAEVEEHLKEVCGGETLRPYQVWPVHFLQYNRYRYVFFQLKL